MRVVTDEEMREFLSKHEGLRCEGWQLRFDYPEAKPIRVDFGDLGPGQLIHLTRLIEHLRYEEPDFLQASLWVTNSRDGDDRLFAVLLKAIERIRQGYGENRSLESAPGHFFRHDEFVESISLLIQPMLAGWDAYYVPQWAWGTLDYFVFVNNDSFFEIQTRTTEIYEKSLEILKSENWIKNRCKFDYQRRLDTD